MLAGQLALITSAMFFGAAIYINVAEQPARLRLDDKALLSEWKLSYKRGLAMQASLAIIGFLLGMLAWWTTSGSGIGWIIGSLLLLANWPFTLLVIMPTNNQLMAIEPDLAGADSRALIETWGGLHSVRSLLGLAATASFLWASLR